MPSSYSSLKIQLMQQGENNNQWGDITNTNLGTAIEEAITGSVDVPFSSGPVTLTLTDTNTTQSARNLRLNLTGTSGGAQNLIVPAIEKFYVVNNGCADAITVKNTTGTGIAVPAGKTMLVFNNATNVVDAVTHLTSLTLASSLPVTSGGTGTTTSTGTGSVVLSNSPALVTPALGTPASGVLTNATGLPISTGVSGLGTGVATFLGTPSSSNLAAAVTDETGSGALVFGTSPTITSASLVTPALGTPASGVMTNVTGLPISTGVSGLGAGVATFLGTPSSSNLAAAVTDETGTGALVFATSPTLVTPALGTPASGVLTNATGLPIIAGTTGTLSVARGGTGVTSLTSNGVLYGGATVGATAEGATGQVLVGNTGGAPSWGAATGVAVTSISFGSTGLTPSTATQGVVTVAGTLAVANGGTGVTTSTGTGSVVLSTSPTLVTPALGTPASGVMTNVTGLPISTGVSGLGTGVATFLGTPSSANLAAAVTDETGTGALVFANTPTLVTPILGTPTSATLTNATGLPISTGVSGLGTGVATFLATPSSANLAAAVTDETGSGALVFATSPTLVTPALGTPSSATLTNATGLPISTGVSGLGAGVATFLATPSSANLAAAVTDETGSGALVFANTPTLVTPVLGAASATSLALAAGLVATPSLTFTGDLNTGMWSPAADTIAWSTAGTERMRITSAGNVVLVPSGGNVSIGTFTVSDKLTISGGGIFIENDTNGPTDTWVRNVNAGSSARSRVVVNAFGNSWGMGMGSSANNGNALTWNVDVGGANTEVMRITTGGNVGIGTTSPQAKLVVSKAGAEGLEITPGDSAGLTRFLAYNRSDSTYDDLALRGLTIRLERASGDTSMYLDSSGNVGIGTSSPSQKLDVAGNVYISQRVGLGVAPSTTVTLKAQGPLGDWCSHLVGNVTTGQSYGLLIDAGTNSSDLSFLIRNASAANMFAVRGDGNVGIGTTSTLGFWGASNQDTRLCVAYSNSTATTTPTVPALVLLNTDTTANNTTALVFGSVNNAATNVGQAAIFSINGTRDSGWGTGQLVFSVTRSGGGGPTEAMRIDATGNVGIGCTPLSFAKFQVSLATDRRFTTFANGADNTFGYLDDAGNWISTLVSGSPLRLGAGGAEAMRIVSGGNVGIGTSSPDVFGRGYSGKILGISSSGQSAIELNSATGSGAYLDLGVNGSRVLGLYADSTSTSMTTTGAQTINIATTGAADVTLGTNNAERVRISSSGQVTPGVDNTQNLGSGSLRWATIFAGGVTISSAAAMLTSSVAMNNGAGASAGTMTNAPAAGNPTKWIPFNDNGTTRYIPAW